MLWLCCFLPPPQACLMCSRSLAVRGGHNTRTAEKVSGHRCCSQGTLIISLCSASYPLRFPDPSFLLPLAPCCIVWLALLLMHSRYHPDHARQAGPLPGHADTPGANREPVHCGPGGPPERRDSAGHGEAPSLCSACCITAPQDSMLREQRNGAAGSEAQRGARMSG